MIVPLTCDIPREWSKAFAVSASAVILVGVLAEFGVWAWIMGCAVIFAVIVAPRLMKDPWQVLCFFILPMILTGSLGMFVVGKQTRISPALVVIAPCIAMSSIGVLWKRELSPRRLPLLIPFLLYFTAALLSGIPSVNKLHWVHGVLDVGLGYGFFLFGCIYLENRKQLHLFLKLLIGLGIVTVFFSLFQEWSFDSIHGWLPLIYNQVDLVWLERWHQTGRLPGNWTHPGQLGSILNLVAPVALYYYLESETFRIAAFVAYAIVAFGIIMTGTRSTMVAFAASQILLLALIRRRLSRVLVPLIAFLALLAAAAPLVIDSLERFDLSDPGNELSVETRSMIQFETFLLFVRNPILGVGYYNYPDRMSFGEEGAQQAAHNVFLQTAAETGLVGIVTFVILLGMSFRGDFRRGQSGSPELRELAYVLFAACVATLIECLAENPLYVWQVACLFWLFRGMSVAIRTRPRDFMIPELLVSSN